jgi:Tol biopolymer transport system component
MLKMGLCLLAAALFAAGADLGVFTESADVGITPQKGAAEFDAASGEYRITGGGANMWQNTDAFHFLWTRVTGDAALTADIRFLGSGVDPHRKAALMFRQELEPGSAYADIAVHGDGLTSLQYRPVADALTLEARSELNAPVRVRIERRSERFLAFAGEPGGELKPVGPVAVSLRDPVYVGLAVCAHNAGVRETAVFSNVKLEQLSQDSARPRVRSRLSIYDLRDDTIQVIYTADRLFEAPNWSPDGKYLLINSGGDLYRVPLQPAKAEPEKIDLGGIAGCNNDHGISPNGRQIVFSARHNAPGSQVYLANADGSNARLMTPQAPSYYHGWSPDGKWLAYVGQRGGNFDVYRISVDGGAEQRLTTHAGLDDGPDYSPDGNWIYINSDRTGNFDIWRFPAAGAGPDDKQAQQVTSDEWEDWFPHPSPDGKWIVFVSFEKGTKGHPANRNVQLRMIPMPKDRLEPAAPRVLAKLFGGQGTINVNSWSPDSRRFAFVSYEPLPSAPAE